jgi:hypothetical protein
MGVVIVVDVLEVVIAQGCHEASKSSLMSVKKKTSPSGVLGPLVCSPSSSWLALVTEYLVVHVVVDLVIVAIVA